MGKNLINLSLAHKCEARFEQFYTMGASNKYWYYPKSL